MNKIIWLPLLITAIFLFSFAGAPQVRAGEVDILINKLVEKGVLTEAEGRALLKEMQSEAVKLKSTVEQTESDTPKKKDQKEAKTASVDMPKWVQKIKLKGDFRLRYETLELDNTADRDRLRIRWRLGATAKVTDRWKVGFGLASDGENPRSTNQTLHNSFDTPDVRLDYAYVQYDPWKFLSTVGGKFKNPIWGSKDLIWDSDIRPEGITAAFTRKTDSTTFFVLPAWFTLAEFKADESDPYMWVLQGGVKADLSSGMYVKGAVAYYGYQSLTGNSFNWSSKSNSTDDDGNLTQDYDAWNLDGEFGIKLNNSYVPMMAAFGQYIDSEANGDDVGYLAGFKFGHSKVKKFAQWQIKYNYRRLERDAVPDFLPDADFYFGQTNTKGHEAEFKFGLAKNVDFGLDYYWDVRPIEGPNTDKKETLLQVDLGMKW